VKRWENKKGMETILPAQNKLVLDSERNEENVHPVPDPNKTKIDYPQEKN
jgi:hypothetical protein